MKTIRTILATFGVTTLLYGLFAMIAMRLDLAFTGRSIYQLFRDTGFAAMVLGIGCVLSFVIMTIALVAFRDDSSRKKHDIFEEEDEEEFLEEETVPEERAEEADETWTPEIKRKQRKALLAVEEPEEETPNLFDDDDDEEERIETSIPIRQEPEPETTEAEPRPEAADTEEPVSEESKEEMTEEPPAEEKHPKKRCSYCGALIDADSAFCNCCGKRV